jgi:hypothetical protein
LGRRIACGLTTRAEVPGWVPRLVRWAEPTTPSSWKYSAFSRGSKAPNAGKRSQSHPLVASSRERRETVENCPAGRSGRSHCMGARSPAGLYGAKRLGKSRDFFALLPAPQFPPARFPVRGKGQYLNAGRCTVEDGRAKRPFRFLRPFFAAHFVTPSLCVRSASSTSGGVGWPPL